MHYLAIVIISMYVYSRFPYNIVRFVDIGTVPNFGQCSFKGVDTFELILVGHII
jgi:hypothetical protein